MKIEFILNTIENSTSLRLNAYDLSGVLKDYIATTIADTDTQSVAQW
jgi:hypothetical protein